MMSGYLRLGQLAIERKYPLIIISFLHACSTGCGDYDERIFALDSELSEARDLFADHRSHRSTHESEVHDGQADRHSAELTREGKNRVAFARVRCRLLESRVVIGKAKRI